MCDDKKNGNQYDVFKDDIFSWREWSAPKLIFAEDIRTALDRFALVGRRIKEMQILGTCYTYIGFAVEERAYGKLEHLSEEERERKSQYLNIDPEMMCERWAEIDEVFMITFDDGDVFEIDTPWEMEFRMSMNRIPWYTESSSWQNLDADVLFSNCLGQEITAVEIGTDMREVHPITGESFTEPPLTRECVEHIILRLANGLALKIYGCDDFCEVECIDANGKTTEISFGELKKGLYNWEDLHGDEVTGFEAESDAVFFNEKGVEYIGGGYLTFVSSGWKEAKLYISEDDVVLIDWCVSLKINEWFDEYSAYHFSYEEWDKVLAEADEIFAAKSFDDLFDMLIARQGGNEYMMKKLNFDGADFWKNKERYRRQIEDLRKWSKIVLKRGNTMNIYGY
ncbi:MAG: hypothetical protein II324_00925 [Selenomonadales bacterium]|nr:hypothetical protein [Selenomonadales bacterium]